MNPKVLAIYTNAQVFLSTEEMQELAGYIAENIGTKNTKPKSKSKKLTNWTVENTVERLMANQFKK